MKTETEWGETFPPYRDIFAHIRYHPLNKDEIKQIQLDAMNEGMRRAAKVVMETMATGSPYENRLVMESAILDAAKKITKFEL